MLKDLFARSVGSLHSKDQGPIIEPTNQRTCKGPVRPGVGQDRFVKYCWSGPVLKDSSLLGSLVHYTLRIREWVMGVFISEKRCLEQITVRPRDTPFLGPEKSHVAQY